MDASQKTGITPDALGETTVKNICEVCGGVGAVKIGDRWLCESCYVEAGSCCPEFGASDLWDFDETKPV